MKPLRAEIAEWDSRPHAPAVRFGNGISYLTVRRFSTQDRLNALPAVKRFEDEANDRETALAAAKIATTWSLLTGNPGGWTVTSIAGTQRRKQLRRAAPRWLCPSDWA
jgi:hypothetical protein